MAHPAGHEPDRSRRDAWPDLSAIQKYEKGVNRISASRLYRLNLIFGVPVESFLEEIEGEGSSSSPDDVMPRRETLELARAYYRIRDPEMREVLHAMTKAMG